jgi:tRNA threonylcarbamoyladenosine biosynthesis protein TsaB
VNLLALDTCTEACSVAFDDGIETRRRFLVTQRGHADRLLSMVEAILADAQVRPSELAAVVFGRGPGSFTGVRIGVATAQGLAMAASCPVLPVSTLAAMALGARRRFGGTQFAVALDARMGEVYWGQFDTVTGQTRLQGEECVCSPQTRPALGPGAWVGVGSGWIRYPDSLRHADDGALTVRAEQHFPDARDMLTLARPILASGGGVPAAAGHPTYLRDQVAFKQV